MDEYETLDSLTRWLIALVVAAVGAFAAGAAWHGHVQPPVLVREVPVAPSVTAATSAPPVPASIEAGT